jgi:ABC-2 type transport system permease protein
MSILTATLTSQVADYVTIALVVIVISGVVVNRRSSHSRTGPTRPYQAANGALRPRAHSTGFNWRNQARPNEMVARKTDMFLGRSRGFHPAGSPPAGSPPGGIAPLTDSSRGHSPGWTPPAQAPPQAPLQAPVPSPIQAPPQAQLQAQVQAPVQAAVASSPPGWPASQGPLQVSPNGQAPSSSSGSRMAPKQWLDTTKAFLVVEMKKQFPRWRTILALGMLTFVPILVTIAYAIGGTTSGSSTGLNVNFFLVVTKSGFDMAFADVTAMAPFMLVVVVALFAGEPLTSEATWGTLRYLLARPVPRSTVLIGKLVVACLLTVAACILISLAGLASGLAAFGWHPLVTPQLLVYGEGRALEGLFIATFYTAWSMSSVVALTFMVSTMTDSVIGAVAGGIGFAVISEIFDGIPALGSIRKALPTHYLAAWTQLFVSPAHPSALLTGALVQLPYDVIFLGIAFWWFNKKDVVS